MTTGPSGARASSGLSLTVSAIAAMVDLSAVRTDTDEAEVAALARAAIEYGCACAYTLPSQTSLIRALLADHPEIRVGGVVGFPSGGTTTRAKVAEARELIHLGCGELDTVINVGLLRSRRRQRVLTDIAGVVEAAGGVPVKVILECHYLTDDEIRTGCELCIEGGASYVKTGTGWAPTGATLQNISLIKSCVGEAIGIKAAGGIRRLETLLEMYRRGARRFGIGLRTAPPIFAECAARFSAPPDT